MFSPTLEMYIPQREKEGVESSTSTIDEVNLQYISGCKPHLTSWFYKIELGLKFTS